MKRIIAALLTFVFLIGALGLISCDYINSEETTEEGSLVLDDVTDAEDILDSEDTTGSSITTSAEDTTETESNTESKDTAETGGTTATEATEETEPNEQTSSDEHVTDEEETTASETKTAETESSEQNETLVWIPAKPGKYHKTSTCSGMQNPRQVTIEEAEKEGYAPCKRCFKD